MIGRKKILTLASLVTLFAMGCQKGLMTWNDKAGIYFTNSQPAPNFTPTDSISTTFGFCMPNVTDSIVGVPIRIIGSPAGADRPYTLTVLDSSTAKVGVHYDFVNKTFAVKAGKVVDTVWVDFHRTPDMQLDTLRLYLRLDSNANFMPELSDQVNASGQVTLHMDFTKLTITDVLTQPKYWMPSALGTFSRKKLLLVCSLNALDPGYFNNSTLSTAVVNNAARATQRWLNAQAQAGQTVYEADGVTPMTMGTSAQ